MELFIFTLTDILHFVKILIICSMFFRFQKREFKYNIIITMLVCVTLVATSVLIFILQKDFLETLLYILLIVSLVYLIYEEKIQSIVAITLWVICASSLIDILNIVLVNVFLKLVNLNWDNFANLIASCISLIFICVMGSLYKKKSTSSLRNIGIVNLLGFSFLLCADVIVVSAIFYGADIYSGSFNVLYLSAVILVILGIFIQLAAVIILFTQRNVYKEKEMILNTYLNAQKNHYEYLENREKETKKFRHDLRSHMELISSLIKNGEYDKIDDYIKQMNLKIDTFGNVVTVHNGIVDAIINQYYVKAKQNGIEMEVRGMFPVDCVIETFDLCTIFSNALSNAYEAAVEAEEKYILLECRYTDQNIIVLVENSFNHKMQNSDRQSKKNRDYHGFGLENIRDSVNKYNGFFDIEKNENKFSLKIIFNYVGK